MRYINRFTSETKFLVSETMGDDLRAWLVNGWRPDPNGGGPYNDQYGVVSIYFDTDAHDVYQRHGSYGPSKYRIRHYENDKAAFSFKDIDKFGLRPHTGWKYRFAVHALNLAAPHV